jgi:putative transposase
MPRTARVAPGGRIYHVLNRAAARFRMLRTEKDFLAFEKVLNEAAARCPLRILSYCVMSNHWHFVVYPREDGELTDFFRWLTHTHAMRWRVAHKSVGMGPLYQGRFKSFPVQADQGLESICRYVERNALSAGLVKRAQDWKWSSLYRRLHGDEEARSLLTDWPVKMPADWLAWVNRPLTPRELERIEMSLKRDRPLGSDEWTAKTASRLGMTHTLRSEGRPRKEKRP